MIDILQIALQVPLRPKENNMPCRCLLPVAHNPQHLHENNTYMKWVHQQLLSLTSCEDTVWTTLCYTGGLTAAAGMKTRSSENCLVSFSAKKKQSPVYSCGMLETCLHATWEAHLFWAARSLLLVFEWYCWHLVVVPVLPVQPSRRPYASWCSARHKQTRRPSIGCRQCSFASILWPIRQQGLALVHQVL